MTNDIQVVTIGNAFELVYENELPYSSLTELGRADESHFAQKATFWTTRYGFPRIVICSARPSETILDRIYENLPRPAFIEPQRRSTSICSDLLHDTSAMRTLLSTLERGKRVFLAPYVHTPNYELLANSLINGGYEVVDYRRQASLVKRLWSKTEAESLVFEAVDILKKHRPKAVSAASDVALVNAIRTFARSGIDRVVVKSDCAVGGSGVFYLNSNQISRSFRPNDFLLSTGQNEAKRSAPFIVEEYIHWDVSPTVDLDVSCDGHVDFLGIALQRLHDRRYYNGFYSSPALEQRWWFSSVESVAKAVGLKLFSLGYTGPANIDFVVSSKEQRVALIEVNPRRSALIDGYGIRNLRFDLGEDVSVSATDYLNISNQFDTVESAFHEFPSSLLQTAEILPVADAGFSTKYRWVGVLTAGCYPTDSEDILIEVVSKLQDHDRDETGSTGENHRTFSGISRED